VPVAGLLLTGGASTRLGTAKAELTLGGERLVDRGARVLGAVCERVLEVGPGIGSIPCVQENPPGEGPLAALASGGAALRALGHDGPVLAMAVDLPFVEPPLLEWLAGHAAPDTVVPRVDGMAQSLCARYASEAVDVAQTLVTEGERSMRALLAAVSVVYEDEAAWAAVADARSFLDVDTPEDMARAGLQTPG